MEFTAEKIKKVAQLAKIKLSEEEITLFNEQFISISHVITKLQKVDTTAITPVHNPLSSKCLMREDKITDGNYANNILSNAPKSSFNCFVVPKVVE